MFSMCNTGKHASGPYDAPREGVHGMILSKAGEMGGDEG